MNSKIVAVFIACMPFGAFAQTEPTPPPEDAPVVDDAEKIVVTGLRRRYALRVQMLGAEKAVYDTFNKFNDEPRYEIECDDHEKRGSHIGTTFCMPGFKGQALAAEGQDYLAAYRAFLDTGDGDYEPSATAQPAFALIMDGQVGYKRKMQQVAREQPEFLRALVRYTEIKSQYEAATSMAGEPAAAK
jgi:hypothetical protein